MEKTIQIYKHPYMWNVVVKFGTLQEMLNNSLNDIASREIVIGGSFNGKMNGTRRAALINIGVEISPSPDHCRFPKAEDVKEVKGICSSPWEGVYWYENFFNDELKQGLYPINADWDGKTYIERWTYKGENKAGVPIPDKKYYELTDTYRY